MLGWAWKGTAGGLSESGVTGLGSDRCCGPRAPRLCFVRNRTGVLSLFPVTSTPTKCYLAPRWLCDVLAGTGKEWPEAEEYLPPCRQPGGSLSGRPFPPGRPEAALLWLPASWGHSGAASATAALGSSSPPASCRRHAPARKCKVRRRPQLAALDSRGPTMRPEGPFSSFRFIRGYFLSSGQQRAPMLWVLLLRLKLTGPNKGKEPISQREWFNAK